MGSLNSVMKMMNICVNMTSKVKPVGKRKFLNVPTLLTVWNVMVSLKLVCQWKVVLSIKK